MLLNIDVRKYRTPDHPVEPLLVNRWSPRAMSGQPLSGDDLLRLLEAARWAPSSYNEQPWRFLYAQRGGPHWQTFFDLLVEGNQVWAKNAAVLFVVVSRTTFARNNQPNRVHTFDCGAAWQNLALQACAMGLVAHGMVGFDHEKARQVLDVPDDHRVEAMIAVGRPGRIEDLPQRLREREFPSPRKPVSEWAWEGKFRR